jgi:hypothetical protein
VIDVFTYWEFQCVFSERAENKKPRRIGVLGVKQGFANASCVGL